MAYSDLPFQERVKTLGDAAETVFLEVSPLGKAQRFGWRRPSVPMSAMSPFIRHTPDYYAGTGWLVEVMGCGQDGIVKLKEDKYKALLDWNKHQKVALFVSNSAEQTWVLAPMNILKKHVGSARRDGRVNKFENDGNVYFELPYIDLVTDEATIAGDTP